MARRKLTHATAIVTGATSGIGREMARQLAAATVNVVVGGRRTELLDQLVETIQTEGGRAVAVAGDVTNSDTRRQLIESAERQFGGLDILVNNAGIGAMGPFAEATPERLRKIMEVNFFAAAELTRTALKVLARSDRISVLAQCRLHHCSNCRTRPAPESWKNTAS